jgi:hypothetical protein
LINPLLLTCLKQREGDHAVQGRLYGVRGSKVIIDSPATLTAILA